MPWKSKARRAEYDAARTDLAMRRKFPSPRYCKNCGAQLSLKAPGDSAYCQALPCKRARQREKA